MIFKDNLYSIVDISLNEGVILANIELNASHDVYSGHFPGNPVTPGVVQLEIVREILALHFDRSFKLKSMRNCKYLAILNPHINSNVTLRMTVEFVENECVSVSGDMSAEDITFMKFQSLYC